MELVEPLVRYFLGIFFLMIGLQFTGRTLGLYDRTGASHIYYGQPGSKGWWHRHIFNLFRAAILAICVGRIFTDLNPWLGVIGWLYHPTVLLSGMVLLLVSFTLVNYLQAYMHQDWRSGADTGGDSGHLLTEGPYRRTRNPLFMAVILGQLGFFLALPSIFSLVCLVVGAAVIMRQARVEEGVLEARFGEQYRQYRDKTPRWL
jgi:protein-S-isoprenylcysteine O-methyltransferase Ste14